MSFKAYMIEKLRQLVGIYYQLNSNGADELKALREEWAFLDPNPHEVYNQTVQNKR